MSIRFKVLLCLLASVALFADGAAPNISGTWVLNADHSRWGKHPRPTSVMLAITHQEPAFKYTGEVIKPGEEAAREFSFDGAIDGKSYPAKGSGGDGNIVFKRVDPRTIESLYTSNDGTLIEHARTSISADGKHLTRELRIKTQTGEETWTEIYDRK